jgi:hypothetical protein
VSRKKHKVKKAKRRSAESSSDSEASSGSDSDMKPEKKTHHHAHRLCIEPKQMLRVLRAVSHHIQSCAKAMKHDIFVAHPDSGALNHMTNRQELFNLDLFETLKKPIPISLGDDSEIFATRRGRLHLMFNIDGK